VRRYNLIAVGIFLLAVAGLFALSPRNTRIVQSKFLGFIAPFLKTGSSLQLKWIGLREGLKTLPQLEQENTQLRVELKQLKATNQLLNDLGVENNKLRRALEYRERSVFKLVPARIIARDAATWWSTVKIDKGSADGVQPDMPVLTEDGLVGKTTLVADSACTVLLISDENCKVAATVEGTREQGIVKGERTSTAAMPDLSLNFISKNADLKAQQKVYSSGVGGVYPSGVLIGVVKNFEVRPLDGYATVIPAVDLTTLEDVFIVTGKK
jgi:rod shape-determining protein MreC